MKPLVRWTCFAVALAALTALCASRSTGRTGAPDGWHRMDRGQPFVSEAVLATGPQPWGAWSMSAYEGMVGDAPGSSLSVDAELPDSGRLTLTLNHEAATSTGLVLAAGEAPIGTELTADGPGATLRCAGALPPTAPGRVSVTLTRTDAGWTATSGTDTMTCTAPASTSGAPALVSGLRRVHIHTVSTDAATPGGTSAGALAGGLAAGAALFALLFWVARTSTIIATAMGAASLSGWVLAPLDGGRLAEILRLIETNGDQIPVSISIALMVLTGTTGLAIRWAGSRPLPWTLGATSALFLAIAAAWPVIGAMGWLYSLFGGLTLGGLVWVNVHAARIRHYNWMALGLACGLLGSAEVMIRYSHVGSLWNAADTHHGAGSMNTLFKQFEGLEAGVHSVYPSGGFPVRLPAKTAPVRIACLGASSTGGAFQNDSLDDFYPARLAQDLPAGTEIVNQGVGGWTSFHIRRFLDGHVDTLDAEIWTVYLGVNEHMPTRMSYADLYSVWKSGDGQPRLTVLDNIRLFQALRLLVRGLDSGAGAGVPPGDFEDNLNAILSLADARGVKVLLMNEGIRPDPKALWQYTEVMQRVASANESVEFLDTAAALDAVGDTAFMDSNHLTDLGHRTVATAMKAKLNALGWW